MRTLAELPHPDFKITIFGMNDKYIIKYEKGLFEQTFKIAQADVVGGVNGVFELLDETFNQAALERFFDMKKSFGESYRRHY